MPPRPGAVWAHGPNGTFGDVGRGITEMTDPQDRLWPDLLAHLRAHHPGICRQWFEHIESLGVAGGVLRLRAQSPVHRDYLQRQCLSHFNEAARDVSGRLLSVRLFGPDDELDPVTDAKPAVRTDALVINPDYAFENFVIGPNNRLAHAAARAVVEKPGRAYNPLFIHGGVGLGKTHLLQAICLKMVEHTPSTALYYISCEGFRSQYTASLQATQLAEFRHRFRDVDVLVVDDIHFLTKQDNSQEEFFHTFNSLYQSGKQIILSSDAAPEEILHLEERLVSRFKCGLVTQIQAPGYESRVEIIKKKARLRGIDLPEDVAGYVATRIDSNIRELEGAITKMQVQSMVEGQPIDLRMAQLAVGDPVSRTSNDPTIQTVIGTVTEFYGVRLTDLQSKRRHRSVTLPRQVCMYLARENTRHSLEEIGGYFGGRDHTTVMHAIKTVAARRRKDAEFDSVVVSLGDRLRRPKS